MTLKAFLNLNYSMVLKSPREHIAHGEREGSFSSVFPTGWFFPFCSCSQRTHKSCCWNKKFLIIHYFLLSVSNSNFQDFSLLSPLQSYVCHFKISKTLMLDVEEDRRVCLPMLLDCCRKLFPYILAASSFDFFHKYEKVIDLSPLLAVWMLTPGDGRKA